MAKDDEEVGYGKPPKKNQFKKGKSGNPKGRPKGSTNFATRLVKIANTVPKDKEGRSAKMNYFDMSCTQLANKSANGDLKAIEIFHKSLRSAGAEGAASFDVKTLDEITRDFLKEIQNPDSKAGSVVKQIGAEAKKKERPINVIRFDEDDDEDEDA